MKAAFTYWGDRISPVFDSSRRIHIVETAAGRVVEEARETLPDGLPVQKVLRLTELGVGTLVCGAISRQLRELVEAYGIQVIAFVAGDLAGVVQAWRTGDIENDAFAMPGCRGRSKNAAHGHERYDRDRRGPVEE